MTPKTLQPSATNPFRGPVVALVGQRTMSSGEWFALMIRACANGRLVGDRTRGASGPPALP
jgi:C-terminal processing protease CtpA/Prc